MTRVQLQGITKRFGDTTALDHVTLDIPAGDLFFLLGPSGCGKSTLLRLIAGLHEPTAGKILFNDEDVTALGTEKRNAVMCFQSYALWPHMSVRENVRFGLNVKGTSRAQQDKRIDEMLDLVQMTQYADRKPNQLSGGQQQRVALARAIAVEPAVLLLDEPLSNLDAKLRNEMRTEIRRICKTSGLTTIYVTHDQKEALSVADQIAVLKDGHLMQVGSPGTLYHSPNSAFVADFVGNTNLLPGKIVATDEQGVTVATELGRLKGRLVEAIEPGGDCTVSIRPEQMQFADFDKVTKENRLQGVIESTTFLGEASEHVLASGGEDGGVHKFRVVAAPPRFDFKNNAASAVQFDQSDVVVLPR